MAKSEQLIRTHAEQKALAEEVFKNQYKEQIVKELVDALNVSYITPDAMQDIWQSKLSYNKEIEHFLLHRTHMFIVLLSNTNKKINTYYKSPTFLKNFIGFVSEYLAPYICKKGIKGNECRQQIRNTLLNEDAYTRFALKQYAKAINKEYKLKQEQMSKKTAAKKEAKRKRFHTAGQKTVQLTPKQQARLRSRQLKQQIKEAKELLGNKNGIVFTPDQNAAYQARLDAAKTAKFNTNKITIEVYVNSISR